MTMHVRPRLIVMLVAIGVLMLLPRPGIPADEAKKEGSAPSKEAVQFFESKVRPVLADHCFKCHGESKHKGNLRLDSRAAILAGGDQGPAIVPGQPDKSLLIKAINHADEQLKMPPKMKLTKEQIADLTVWVKLGAPWPGTDQVAVGPKRGERVITDKDRAHWAFQPIKPSSPPAVRNPAWVSNPIDAFILARLEAKRLQPSPPATKRELIRRVYYDVTGLPPTPKELEQALNDESTDWFEKLVDHLLNSPHYGEKWGRHWLDLVRYAETNSYERDNPKPHAWRYRDYVIRSFNDDKPYDQFIREQLAGDELYPGAEASGHVADALIATGFYRLGIWDDEPTDRMQAKYDGLDDIIATTGHVFLGLTLDCARCHDHKIDPIPQKDYYRILSFFHNVNHFHNGGPSDEAPIFSKPGERASYEEQMRALERRKKELQTALSVFEVEFRKLYEQVEGRKVADGDVGKLALKDGARLLGKERFESYQQQRRELDAVNKQKVPAEMALCISEAGNNPPETFVAIRGNPHVKGDKVEPAFPQILGGVTPTLATPVAGSRTTGRRLVLANWIASRDNPLTARVMANRLWQHHFGRGIVRSSSNFGLQGDRPTHPELLDWLATELVNNGWRLKALHKRILMSNAYRMSSKGNPAGLSADPANDLFWRFDMRRLTAEEIRDAVHAVNGSLNPKMFGPGIYVDIPREVLEGQSMPGKGWGKSSPEEQNRRSVYIHVKRSLLTPILESFDVAETDRSSPVRFSTTQPTQALGMLNSGFANRQAEVFAARLRAEAGSDTAKQVRTALYLATSRQPSDAEIKRGVELIDTLKTKENVQSETALKYFCLMVLNLNEFVYID